jgi:hypothetical protein
VNAIDLITQIAVRIDPKETPVGAIEMDRGMQYEKPSAGWSSGAESEAELKLPSPPWSPAEDAQLVELAGKGSGARSIARQLTRTESSVRNRARRLRVKVGRQEVPPARKRATPAHPFLIGDRVRLSEFGRSRHPRMLDTTGTVVGMSISPSTVSVQFDHRKSAVQIHCSYLKLEADHG